MSNILKKDNVYILANSSDIKTFASEEKIQLSKIKSDSSIDEASVDI